MRILLTGHKGFIGKNFHKKLESMGHEVVGYDIKPFRPPEFPKVEGMDLVIHLGAMSNTTEKNPDIALDMNYDFSYKLLMECCEHKVDMQYASSASVYGHVSPWQEINETYPYNPLNPYAWSKYLFDRLLLKSFDSLPIKVQGFRYFNVWGPHEDEKGGQSSLHHKWIKETGNIKIFEGSNRFYRDFIHVDDIFNLQYKMSTVNESGIYNIGTGFPRSIQELAEAIAKKHNKDIEEIEMPDELKDQYQSYTCADNQKILNATSSVGYKFIQVTDVNELLEDTRHH